MIFLIKSYLKEYLHTVSQFRLDRLKIENVMIKKFLNIHITVRENLPVGGRLIFKLECSILRLSILSNLYPTINRSVF